MAKEIDGLLTPVFDDLEVLLRQIGDGIAFVISDDDVYADEIDAGAKCRPTALRGRPTTLRRRSILRAHQPHAGEHQQQDDWKSVGAHSLQSNLMSSFSCGRCMPFS